MHRTDPVQFVLVKKQQESHPVEIEQSLEAKKRVIQLLMELAFVEQGKETVHLLG
jgi:hypothetical protein